MRSALLKGYFGYRNAGDDAFLLVSAWGAARFLGCDSSLVAAAVLPELRGLTVRRLPMGPFGGRPRQFQEFVERRAAHRVEAIVFGGGSNFHSYEILCAYRKLLRRGKRAHRRAVGVSIGPFRDRRSERECSDVLREFDFVGVRDAASFDRVRSLSSSTPVALTFDLALLMPEAVGKEARILGHQSRRLGLALCHYERFVGGDLNREADRVRAVADAALLAWRDGVFDTLVIVEMNSHPTFGDRPVSGSLRDHLYPSIPVEFVPYNGDPVQTLQTIGSLRGLLAMRLHASVFGFMSDVQVGILSYHEKCDQWARSIGLPAERVVSVEALRSADVHRLMVDVMTTQRAASLSIGEAVDRARANWTYRDE